MKLNHTSKTKVFFSDGEYFSGQQPCGYFQWLHGPLWRPRDQAQPLPRRWVKEPVPWRDNAGFTPMWKTGELSTPFMSQQRWLNQFAESAEAQRNQGLHFHKKYGSGTLFWTKCIYEKNIEEKDIKLSCISISMFLPLTYEDPHERGVLGGVEPFATAHQLKTPQAKRILQSVLSYTLHKPRRNHFPTTPTRCLKKTSNGRWIWWTCKNSVDGIRDISGWHRNKSQKRQCPRSGTNSTASAWTKRPHPSNVKSGIACDSTRNIVHSKKAIYRGGQKKCLWSCTFVVIWWSRIDSVNGTEGL